MTAHISIYEHLGMLLTMLEQQGATIRELSRTIEKIRSEQSGLSARVMQAETVAGRALRLDGISLMVVDVAAEAGVSAAAILGPRRDKHIAQARQAVMYLARLEGHSLSDIGRAMGRDHTTVLHGIKAHEERLKREAEGRK
jgi:chromosomal replication initiation ATPase DnaA